MREYTKVARFHPNTHKSIVFLLYVITKCIIKLVWFTMATK